MKKDMVIVSIPIETRYKFKRRKFAEYLCSDPTEFNTKKERKDAFRVCYDYPNEQGGYENEDLEKFIELGILEKIEMELKIEEDYSLCEALSPDFWEEIG